MESERILSNRKIELALVESCFTCHVGEARLTLTELMLKASAGFRNSHTEEKFMLFFKFTKTDRTPNKKGREFLCSVFYTHSNKRPEAFELMRKYRGCRL